MKWVVLAIWLAAVPSVVAWLRRNPRQSPKFWMLMAMVPFVQAQLHLVISPVFWGWRGIASGMELSLLDVLAVCIWITLPRTNQPFPFRWSFGLYFFAVLLSSMLSEVPMASLFYLWQVARVFLLCVVVERATAADDRVPGALLKGFGIALCFEAAYATVQHFAFGVVQAGGTLGHQNVLAMITHFISLPFFALLLAGVRGRLVTMVPLAALMAVLATASRAGMALEGAGFILVLLVSGLRQWTPRKAQMAAVVLVAAMVLTPIAIMRLAERSGFSQSNFFAGEGRAAFEQAASLIWSDYQLGAGPNMFVVTAIKGYYQRANVQWSDHGSLVHNVYLLVAAESGYIGILAFGFMLLHPLMVAFRCGWRRRGDIRGDLMLGFGVSLFIIYLHSMFEFELLLLGPHYMFGMVVGIVGGLAQRMGYWARVGGARSSISDSKRLTDNVRALPQSREA